MDKKSTHDLHPIVRLLLLPFLLPWAVVLLIEGRKRPMDGKFHRCPDRYDERDAARASSPPSG
jgi:hypothetical protein